MLNCSVWNGTVFNFDTVCKQKTIFILNWIVWNKTVWLNWITWYGNVFDN